MSLFKRCSLCVLAVLVWILSPTLTQAQPGNGGNKDLVHRVQEIVEQDSPALVELYKHLHAHPELSFHEKKTAVRLSQELRDLGFEVTTGIGGHGFVGVLRNGSGPTVMIRTDLDALPVVENTGLEYASRVKAVDDDGNEVGVMHACGHDVHMTVFVGTARLLSKMRDSWRGTLVMIGQPAEEKGAGAKAMLADGLYTRFPRPDFALALHAKADLPAGKVAYCPGYALANVDAVDILVRGIGGHGAYPHTTKDPVVLAAQMILALQTIVSREIKPLEPAVVTVGSIHGGTKHNIISDEVRLQLTLRSYSDEVRDQTISAIERITKGIALAAGLPEDKLPKVTVRDEYTPATYNDPDLTHRMVEAMKEAIGTANVVPTEPVMAGEDFGRYGREEPPVPISIFWLGTVFPERYQQAQSSGESLPSLHSSLFAPAPEPTLKTGVRAMVAGALELLEVQ